MNDPHIFSIGYDPASGQDLSALSIVYDAGDYRQWLTFNDYIDLMKKIQGCLVVQNERKEI